MELTQSTWSILLGIFLSIIYLWGLACSRIKACNEWVPILLSGHRCLGEYDQCQRYYGVQMHNRGIDVHQSCFEPCLADGSTLGVDIEVLVFHALVR